MDDQGTKWRRKIAENFNRLSRALNLAHGPETKKIMKNEIKDRVAQEKRSRQRSVEAVREEKVKLRGEG